MSVDAPRAKPTMADAGRGDQRRIELASGPEAPHVQEDQHDQQERAGGGGQSRGPVGDAELLEEAHGAPVVERRFLQPRMAVEDRCDGSGVEAAEGVLDESLRLEAARDDLGVDLMADLGVRVQHLAGDLRVARLVGADQADCVAAEDRNQTVQQQEVSRRRRGRRTPMVAAEAAETGFRGKCGSADAMEPASGRRDLRESQAARIGGCRSSRQ